MPRENRDSYEKLKIYDYWISSSSKNFKKYKSPERDYINKNRQGRIKN